MTYPIHEDRMRVTTLLASLMTLIILSLMACGKTSPSIIGADIAGSVDVSALDSKPPAQDINILDVKDALAHDLGEEQDAASPPADTATSLDVETQTVALVDNGAWVEVTLDEDPFYEAGNEKPDQCPPSEFWTEEMPQGLVFEVNTTFCAYLTVRQELQQDVPAGSTLRIGFAHYEVVDGEGDYFLAVAAGSPPSVVWEKTIELGALEAEYTEEFEIEGPLSSGDEVLFHVSNHGDNHWFLYALEATF